MGFQELSLEKYFEYSGFKTLMKSQSSKNFKIPQIMLHLETKGISLILKFDLSQEKSRVSLGLKGQ